jgi:hypothetical protein
MNPMSLIFSVRSRRTETLRINPADENHIQCERSRVAALAVVLSVFAVTAFAQSLQPGWIADSHTGCHVWNGLPKPNQSIAWSGGCQNGLAQGRGVLQWYAADKPTDRYEGEYRAGKENGRGVNTWANGDRYEGEFRDSKQNGRGVNTWANGDRYEGEFRDGKAHGPGIRTDASGQTYNGIWRDGCFRDGNRRAWIGASEAECR